ncbi:hypothetical protein SAMD00023353_8000070 [Rosellinia necatrix]|uniref:Uncharacterized protein n=1 Tax=Rosellinia necatrix TaxID=77044 RepID=A0A1S8AB82_ROSNE|nr:hypothetical protein SAMD00023353_8000070 [Rosellinia necatrix]
MPPGQNRSVVIRQLPESSLAHLLAFDISIIAASHQARFRASRRLFPVPKTIAVQ